MIDWESRSFSTNYVLNNEQPNTHHKIQFWNNDRKNKTELLLEISVIENNDTTAANDWHTRSLSSTDTRPQPESSRSYKRDIESDLRPNAHRRPHNAETAVLDESCLFIIYLF